MGAELLHVHRHRGGEALRSQRVESQTSAACVFEEVQPALFARLVARHQRRRARDGGVRSGNVGDARLAVHAVESARPGRSDEHFISKAGRCAPQARPLNAAANSETWKPLVKSRSCSAASGTDSIRPSVSSSPSHATIWVSE